MFENVNHKHQDKLFDTIASALLDNGIQQRKQSTNSNENLFQHGRCHIIAETSVKLNKKEVKKADINPDKNTSDLIN